jgi:RimJ/RimL family protein N-acetyltransferase
VAKQGDGWNGNINGEKSDLVVFSRHERSVRVAENCGFALEGVSRNVNPNDSGGFSHLKIYSKVRGVEY